jgi:hypothetical protein
MLITKTSMVSGLVHTLDLAVTQEQLELYAGGRVLLQNAFPQLNADEREFIKTGITPTEWATLFGGGDEEE